MLMLLIKLTKLYSYSEFLFKDIGKQYKYFYIIQRLLINGLLKANRKYK